MKKILLAIMIASMASAQSWAQDTSQKEIVRESLSQSADELSDAESSLERAQAQLNQAQKAIQDIDKMKSNAQKEKKSKKKKILKEAEAKEGPAITKATSAYTSIEKAQSEIYSIYKLNIDNKLVEMPDSKLDKVSELIESADNKWTEAEAAASSIPADKKSALSAHEEYARLQQEAISLQIETLAEMLSPEPSSDEHIPPVEETMAAAAPEPDRIHYKVQIAADVTPLTLEYLQRKIYNTSEVINNEYTDGTYRYLVGRFDTYEEAKAAKIRMKVKGAFVVKYKNGKRQADIKDDTDTY